MGFCLMGFLGLTTAFPITATFSPAFNPDDMIQLLPTLAPACTTLGTNFAAVVHHKYLVNTLQLVYGLLWHDDRIFIFIRLKPHFHILAGAKSGFVYC